MWKYLIFWALISAPSVWSSVEVVFLEIRNAEGQIVFVEPDFPYAHVGLQWQGRILHAHPKTGVVWALPQELDLLGTIQESFSIEIPEAFAQKAESWIGKPYDSHFSWDDEKFYCSELVAKILGIPPEPMHFDPGLWPPSFSELEGKPGISPGKIYRKISGRDFSFR
ncbi:hypothetical protein EBT16_04640 [bacterium]|nr:hypothetical protein [bacterium]